jgi:hypothetical protein
MTRKPIHRFLPLTYIPKIPGVLAGTITQSIRIDTDLKEGDSIAFHGWQGKPYRSSWSFRTPFMTVTMAMPVNIRKNDSVHFLETGEVYQRPSAFLNCIAALDGIDPPTTEELIRVLRAMHGKGYLHGKILRWDPAPIIRMREMLCVDPAILQTPGPNPDQTYNNRNPIMTIEESPFIQIGDIEKQCRDNSAILQ